ncbi:MAG: amidohydrolase family protein [bacterium]
MPRSIVDSHVHVWSDGAVYPGPDHADKSAPQHDATVQTYLAAMRKAGITSAVLVQYIGYRWDNDYVARAIADQPGTFAGVCRVDPLNPDAPDHLSFWTQESGFQGVRISQQPDQSDDWLTTPLIQRLFTRTAQLKVPMLVLTRPARLADLIRLLDRNPDVDVVIDHLADCDAANPDHMALLAALAQNPRVYLKAGHLWVRSVTGYPWRDQHALLKIACDLFGPSRLMWGSDWSFCLGHASYAQTISYLEQGADFLSSSDLDWIMGGTAKRLWSFEATAKATPRPGQPTLAAAPTTAKGA